MPASSPDAQPLLATYHPQQGTLHASAQLLSVTGVAAGSMPGWADLLHSSDLAPFEGALTSLVKSDSAPVHVECRLRQASSNYLPCTALLSSCCHGPDLIVAIQFSPIGSEDRLRRRVERLMQAYEKERRLLAYEIHDGIVQQVIGAQLLLDTVLEPIAHAKPELTESVLRIRHQLLQALDEGRRLISSVRPPIVDELGVVESIRYLVHEEAAADGLQVEFECQLDASRVSPDLGEAVFRIVQEALTNIKRHAETGAAMVELLEVAGELRLVVADDGKGFELSEVSPDRFGIEGMRERASYVGGEAVIHTSPGQGTRIEAAFPFKKGS